MDIIENMDADYTSVKVPRGLMDEFKGVLRDRFGTDYGLIGITIETLIKEYIADKSPAIARTDKVKVLYQKLLEMDRKEVLPRDLTRIIMDSFSIIDQRTIKNYIFSLETLGYITPEKRGTFEVYRINPKKI